MDSQILGNTLSHASHVQLVCAQPFPARFCGTPRPFPSSLHGSPFTPTHSQKGDKKGIKGTLFL